MTEAGEGSAQGRVSPRSRAGDVREAGSVPRNDLVEILRVGLKHPGSGRVATAQRADDPDDRERPDRTW